MIIQYIHIIGDYDAGYTSYRRLRHIIKHETTEKSTREEYITLGGSSTIYCMRPKRGKGGKILLSALETGGWT